LLGQLIAEPAEIVNACRLLRAADFAQKQHANMFALLIRMRSQGKHIDMITVPEACLRDGDAKPYGGIGYVVDLPSHAPSTANAGHYAAIVSNAAERRRIRGAAQQATADIEAGEESGSVVSALLLACSATRKERPPSSTKTDLRRVVDAIERKSESEEPTALPIGFETIDEMLSGGLRPGELAIAAARTSVGKSTFAINVAGRCAKNSHARVLIFSLEMPSDQIHERMLSAVSAVPLWKLRKGRCDHGDVLRLHDAQMAITDDWGDIVIEDQRGITIQELTLRARAHHAADPIGLVIVDYLQKVKPSTKHHSREQEVAEVVAGLFELALEVNAPVLALAQLNRSAITADGAPGLHHIRDSGAIEQDADVVIILHRPGDNEGDVVPLEAHVLKNRNGQLGTVQIRFRKDIQRMGEML